MDAANNDYVCPNQALDVQPFWLVYHIILCLFLNKKLVSYRGQIFTLGIFGFRCMQHVSQNP